MFHVPEKYRLKKGRTASDSTYGNNGHFIIRSIKLKSVLFAQASDGLGWEHVSVSVAGINRCPTWEEMCFVKNLFWDNDDLVIQLHPPESDYVNNHQYCLHLWRKSRTNKFVELPDILMV